MWFLRRRRRQLPLDLSSLERSLDRLAELVERIIGLIPELAAPRPANPRPPPVEPASEPVAEPVQQQAAEEHEEEHEEGHVLFAGGPNGYRLHDRSGAPLPRGTIVELDAVRYVVLRLGPSPLPGDRRRCAYLEREGPPRPEPTAGE
jgi:hypothetical protein